MTHYLTRMTLKIWHLTNNIDISIVEVQGWYIHWYNDTFDNVKSNLSRANSNGSLHILILDTTVKFPIAPYNIKYIIILHHFVQIFWIDWLFIILARGQYNESVVKEVRWHCSDQWRSLARCQCFYLIDCRWDQLGSESLSMSADDK